MRYAIAGIFTLLFATACNKKEEAPATLPDGIYKGTFRRYTNGFSGDVVKIGIRLTGTRFERVDAGQVPVPYYPVIFAGTHERVSAEEVDFHTDVVYTTDFDASLILMDRWGLSRIGDSMILTRSRGIYTDRYKLCRQPD